MMDLSVLLAASDPVAHVADHRELSVGDWWIYTSSMGMLLVSALLLIPFMIWVANRVATGPESEGHDRYITKNPVAHMIEVICVYLKDEVARPLLGDRADRLMPFLWTIFFFILVNNLLGLVPIRDVLHMFWPDLNIIGGTATQNLYITAGLAIVAGIGFNLEALKRLGLKGYLAHLTGGAPWYVAWLLFILELLGQIVIKPGALAIRLFANMTAGHVLLATLLGFIPVAFTRGALTAGSVTLLSGVGAIALMFLELFVGFLQAFIFMFLTAVFISLMDHHEDHEHEHGETAHAH